MKNQYAYRTLNFFVVALAIFSAFSIQSHAKVNVERYRDAIVQKLNEKIRTDLSDNTVEVKLNEIKDREISDARVDFDGKALAVVKNDKTELPFQFTAQIDLKNHNIDDVVYQFVEAASEFAPSAIEYNLMEDLMGKISKDYNTTNIVISIDGYDSSQITQNLTKYEGIGEVRIGDLEWRKINFNVVLDSQNATATQVLYEFQNK
jgi:dipeptidyl aminopeptidase/acylaminoacyl peptidase